MQRADNQLGAPNAERTDARSQQWAADFVRLLPSAGAPDPPAGGRIQQTRTAKMNTFSPAALLIRGPFGPQRMKAICPMLQLDQG
jgi:hypothetical protein